MSKKTIRIIAIVTAVIFVITSAVDDPKADWLEPPKTPIPALLSDCKRTITTIKPHRITNKTTDSVVNTPIKPLG